MVFVIAAVLYVAACVVTIGTGTHPLRPLYEGIGPAAPYRWIHPPAQFKASNNPPYPVSESVTMTPKGSPQAVITSGDGQLVLTLPAGAIPAHAGDGTLLLALTPLDPAKLGALPVALFSDGNAYHVTASYQPSGRPVELAAQPMDAVVVTPVPSAALLQSTDGQTWTRVDDHHIPNQAAVAATITQFGYYMAAANVPVVTKAVSGSTRILLVVGLGLVALVPIVAAVFWRAGRRRRAN